MRLQSRYRCRLSSVYMLQAYLQRKGDMCLEQEKLELCSKMAGIGFFSCSATLTFCPIWRKNTVRSNAIGGNFTSAAGLIIRPSIHERRPALFSRSNELMSATRNPATESDSSCSPTLDPQKLSHFWQKLSASPHQAILHNPLGISLLLQLYTS